jgi:hypothetical protein
VQHGFRTSGQRVRTTRRMVFISSNDSGDVVQRDDRERERLNACTTKNKAGRPSLARTYIMGILKMGLDGNRWEPRVLNR